MNTFGTLFRISIFGESHGNHVGVTVDGCPAGIALSVEDFKADLDRRRSGKKGTTIRKEKDVPQIISGVYNGYTTGSPLTVLFENQDVRSSDYDFKSVPRPGHADFTATKKYGGFADLRGGGHLSGRLTVGLVIAGVIAKKILPNVSIKARLVEAGGSSDIETAVDKAVQAGDSIGGVVECRVNGLPVGLGEPFFNPVESLISHLVFSVPAVKGIEFGAGFRAAGMSGKEHNDLFIDGEGRTASNHAGGVNGGITNGNELYFSVSVKPASSIAVAQETFNFEKGKKETLLIKGRHDVCIALRVPVILEAVAAIVLADLVLIQKALQPKKIY